MYRRLEPPSPPRCVCTKWEAPYKSVAKPASTFFINTTIQVITSTSDKASPNQKLYRLHGEGIVHQASNLYAHDEVRPLFFISDPPHLIKTIRNNLENSRYGGPRCMWVCIAEVEITTVLGPKALIKVAGP